MIDRHEDAHLDAVIAAEENRDFRVPYPAVMKMEHDFLMEAGLLDPGEPTRWSDYAYRQEMTAEFTPEERWLIRAQLGLRETTDG
jgi:hypothetical protein